MLNVLQLPHVLLVDQDISQMLEPVLLVEVDALFVLQLINAQLAQLIIS